MPNLQGGKKYKSSKHSDTKAELHEIDESQGQTIGRVIRVLGNRNMLLYCNDGYERIAHIRGGLRKKAACIELGDIVLFSLRGDGMRLSSDSNGDSKDRGDILAKYDREVYSQLKKMPNVNPRLFQTIETMDARQKAAGLPEDDFGFTFEQGEEKDDESEGPVEGESTEAREARKMAQDKKRDAARNKKHAEAKEGAGDSDVDIDNI